MFQENHDFSRHSASFIHLKLDTMDAVKMSSLFLVACNLRDFVNSIPPQMKYITPKIKRQTVGRLKRLEKACFVFIPSHLYWFMRYVQYFWYDLLRNINLFSFRGFIRFLHSVVTTKSLKFCKQNCVFKKLSDKQQNKAFQTFDKNYTGKCHSTKFKWNLTRIFLCCTLFNIFLKSTF